MQIIRTKMLRNEFVLYMRLPMHDQRISGAGPNVVPLETQSDWEAATAGLPWSVEERTARVMAFMATLLHPDSPPACHQQGAQGAWELADKPWFRDAVTRDVLRLLLRHMALQGTPNEMLLKSTSMALWVRSSPLARHRPV